MGLHLKTFGTEEQYQEFIVSDSYLRHNVSLILSTRGVHYNRNIIPPHDYSKDYLTLDVVSGGTIMWKAKNGVAKTISYSKDDGQNWTEITASSTGTPINVDAGDKVLLKGTNETYATAKDSGSAFSGGTATYNIEGNVMSLIGGNAFTGLTELTQSWALHGLFDSSRAISAENMILPATALTENCYRAMFANTNLFVKAPALPATTLASSCYRYMFSISKITEAPELLAATIPYNAYEGMFNGCSNLNYIKCLATSWQSSSFNNWVSNVAASGYFVKASGTSWISGNSGIPNGWTVYEDEILYAPVITNDLYNYVTITCETSNTDIYYRLNEAGTYSAYTTPFTITADTVVESYSVRGSDTSTTVSRTCQYLSTVPLEYSNRSITEWEYSGQTISTPYSVNAINGHTGNYSKGDFTFETTVNMREQQPTYLWFQHADQTARIYVDDTLVEKHWGGYNAFFSDISSYVHSGTNNIKVTLKNNEGNVLAPYAGDFNFNATLGNVKLYTSTVLPSKDYGYDGFHITSDVSTTTATIYVRTTIPTGATVVCKIDDGNTNVFTDTKNSTGNELLFSTTIQNPHLWNGTIDPYLYTVTLEIYKGADLYHRYVRPYGFRFYEYLFNDTERIGTAQNPFTGFLLNGSPYLLRGVCIHDDLADKANALNDADYTQEFSIIHELGCNFLRLAHYPHPKEVYDKCDELGLIVQTEIPWVNRSTTAETADYWTHLETQAADMVNQHYNHPCILFWGVGNEINAAFTSTEDGKALVKSKIEGYRSIIRTLLPNAWVGYTISHTTSDLLTVFDSPTVDWVGGNMYVGWYHQTGTTDPSSELNKRITKTSAQSVPLAFSEYGAGGTQHCHSESPETTTTKGNGVRHDIEYQMMLHEGHVAAIRNYPNLLSTSMWQLFDVAVSSRNEGYTVCLDGENTSTDDNLRYLNNKGLVERDHVTKKDTFYLYKAEWSSQKFVHICGKDYTKKTSRVIKCYTNDGSLSLYVNNVLKETIAPTNNIVTFTALNFSSNDVVRVDGSNTSDTFTFS